MAYYPPGTRYSDSLTYDEATDRVNEFGDTIFVQKRPDGTLTGREAVVIAELLVCTTVAKRVHEMRAADLAPQMVDALRKIHDGLRQHGAAFALDAERLSGDLLKQLFR